MLGLLGIQHRRHAVSERILGADTMVDGANGFFFFKAALGCSASDVISDFSLSTASSRTITQGCSTLNT